MENEILHTGINKLNELNVLTCKLLAHQVDTGKYFIDGQVLLQRNNYAKKYNVEVKSQILPAQIVQIQKTLKKLAPCILVAEYISTQAKEILRNNKISYLDTAGNIYLNDADLFIYVETNKSNRIKLNATKQAFTKTGLKVIYQFLLNPNYLNKSYREIGLQSKVSIDTVRRVIKGLLNDKYIIQVKKKEYEFVNRTKLFQEWYAAFNKTLRPKLKQNSYRLLNKNDNWKNMKLPVNTYFGGAAAAELMIDYLIADKIIIYTASPFIEIAKELKLIPDPKGNIQLVETFWKTKQEEQNIVNSMLVYADLMCEFDPRYTETANKIYNKYVQINL